MTMPMNSLMTLSRTLNWRPKHAQVLLSHQIRCHSLSRPSRRAEKKNPNKRSTIVFGVPDTPGALEEALRFFRYNKINLTAIKSKWSKTDQVANFFVDMSIAANHSRVKSLLRDLRENCGFAEVLGSEEVPWFPMTVEDVDSLGNNVLEGGSDLQADHPGFSDQEYKLRRSKIAESAYRFRIGREPEIIDYTDDETNCWSQIWDRLTPLLEQHACEEFIESFKVFKSDAGYTRTHIPQMRDINDLLADKTGFRLRPVAGLLSSRDFLHGLAFKIFFCTQYLRHHSVPFYTPEPDLVHELVGHAPMFADPDFCRFSQEIGLASIGATDDQIEALARCYWFSVEFGICKGGANGDERKMYGAGCLSSFGEIEHALSDVPEVRPWDPFNAALQEFPITTFQPIYYMADSFQSATEKMTAYAESLQKPFSCRWDDENETIEVDRNIKRVDD